MADKYTAVWVSHSSMQDYLKCPRGYYLHNMYKDPATGRKMSIVSPHMSLGIAVHTVLEELADYPAEERFKRDLRARFEEEWAKVSGQKGGFKDTEEEAQFKERGKKMIETVISDPRFLMNKRVKLPKEKMNPNFYLSEDDNIILNGQVDWIEYLPDGTLHIIDFKTGRHEEADGSLQLPIYLLLCNKLRPQWPVTKASYWYLETDKMVEKELPAPDTAYQDVLNTAIKVKQAREKGEFHCPKGDYDWETGEGGCSCCRPYEKILQWKAGKLEDDSVVPLGVGGFNQDMYLVK